MTYIAHLDPDVQARMEEAEERKTRASLAELAALVGTVCPVCRSEILQRSDGEVFCWDPYCGQQIDLYRELVATL